MGIRIKDSWIYLRSESRFNFTFLSRIRELSGIGQCNSNL